MLPESIIGLKSQKKDLGRKVTGSKLSASKDFFCCGISVKNLHCVVYRSCDLYIQYQFICEMYWLTAHSLYMGET